MTCIVAIAADGHVMIGGDSAGSNGHDVQIRADEKVFKNGPMIMGFTTSFRMGDLLRYSLTVPEIPNRGLRRWMTTTFIDAVRQCLKDGGYAKKSDEVEKGGNFLVGVAGRLFEIDNDYQVADLAFGWGSVGSGYQIANGSLYTTGQVGELSAKQRITLALNAAVEYSPFVRPPFRFVTLDSS